MSEERALTIDCGDQSMVAVVHLPDTAPGTAWEDGVLVVVGGPQYRVGSHRQFVLLGRRLADGGIPTLRFDHRGIGDSSGEFRGFDTLDDDIRSAADALCRVCPTLERLHIWGLCDAASAALLYAHRDDRVDSLILLNPWVRTEAGLAKAFLTTYYARLLRSRRFWAELFSGRRSIVRGMSSFVDNLRRIVAGSASSGRAAVAGTDDTRGAPPAGASGSFVDGMRAGLQRFQGRVLIIIAQNDITGGEFRDLANADRRWRKLVRGKRRTWVEVAGANHTFSTREWRNEVENLTADWVRNR